MKQERKNPTALAVGEVKTLTTKRLGQEILSIYTTFIPPMFYSFLLTHNTKNILLEQGYLNQDATVHLPTYLLIEIVIPKNTIES